MRILVCWIGITDLLAAGLRENKGVDIGVGPIGQALMAREFDQVVLVSNFAKETQSYAKWARTKTAATVVSKQVDLANPTDFEAVYKIADVTLQELRATARKKKEQMTLTLHLSPGTPVMAAVWIILGKTKYPAELIQTSKENGLQVASIPLDIAAELSSLIPELVRDADAALETRSEGLAPRAAGFGEIKYRCKPMGELVRRAGLMPLRRRSA